MYTIFKKTTILGPLSKPFDSVSRMFDKMGKMLEDIGDNLEKVVDEIADECSEINIDSGDISVIVQNGRVEIKGKVKQIIVNNELIYKPK